MRPALAILGLATMVLASCGRTVGPSSDPTSRATTDIASWANAGMYLPDREQREFFRSNREQVEPLLEAALSDRNQPVRMRAALVIEHCGPASGSLASILLHRVSIEEDRLVRIYIYNALCVHSPSRPEAADVLKKRWDSIDKNAIEPTKEYEPSEASEAVYVAGALSVCAQDEIARKRYASFVLGWLKPPPADLPAERLDAYWDVRWGALAALRSMPPTDGAVPLLEAMLNEPNPKPWVAAQVKATMQVQQRPRPAS